MFVVVVILLTIKYIIIFYVSALGSCEATLLPHIRHGRRLAVKNFRGAVYKYVCDADFKRVGQGQVHCDGEAWDLKEPPVCASMYV
jgi:hypothetical protein